MRAHPDHRLYRALTILSDTAILIGVIMLVLAFTAPTISPKPWILSAGIAGLVVFTARVTALRYRP
ncbi:hypothetical protein [Cumulibacter manganitolerans]|uniref:hypothetical protein n=1 Tax=Cumulibacter manganitolerans TaxID=1884992 RepID=UPI0012957335|nr:hypothetical protein [Cumulibacter manganitolerans]